VQVDHNVVHLRTSLVQLFVLLLQNFEKVVQMIELKRFGGAPNGYPFAPLEDNTNTRVGTTKWVTSSLLYMLMHVPQFINKII
jgi:hypothetical protein